MFRASHIEALSFSKVIVIVRRIKLVRVVKVMNIWIPQDAGKFWTV
jgi:hypothetical protein